MITPRCSASLVSIILLTSLCVLASPAFASLDCTAANVTRSLPPCIRATSGVVNANCVFGYSTYCLDVVDNGTTTKCSYQVAGAETVCRPAVDPFCDKEERCGTAGYDCPDDVWALASTVCRNASTTPYVIPQAVCSGSSGVCPAYGEGVNCTSATGLRACVNASSGHPDYTCTLDQNTYCGNVGSVLCRYSLLTAGTVCRPKQNGTECDAAETCGTSGYDCPTDQFADTSVICRPASGNVPAQNCLGKTVSKFCPVYGYNTNCSAQVVPPCVDATTGVPDSNCTGTTTTYCVNVAATGVTCKYGLKAPGSVCREKNATLDCDAAEVCGASGYNCPPDVVAPNTTICRSANGIIPALYCNGVSYTCPAYGSTTNCTAQVVPGCVDVSSGFADPNCTQSTPSFYCGTTPGGVRCKYGLRVIGALCRPKAGDCDKEEYCGFNVNANPYDCPDDVFASSMQVCRAANGSFPAQLCTGTSPTCPAYGYQVNCTLQTVPACVNATTGVPDPSCNANPSSTYCLSVTGIICKYSLKAPGTVCRPRQTGAGYECDVDDTCGTNGCDCPADGYASNTTVCRDASGAVPAQTCTGVSPACPAFFSSCSALPVPGCVDAATGVVDVSCNQGTSYCLPVNGTTCKFAIRVNGTVCRPKADLCDAPEVCTGINATCPSDVFLPNGTVCNTTNVPAPTCSGDSVICPAPASGVPIMNVAVGVTGSCSDSVYDTVLSVVTQQVKDNANSGNTPAAGSYVGVEKTNCTIGQTSRRRRSLQAGVAVGMYGLRFSAVSTIDESVLAKLRSTFNDFARTVKNPSQGIKVAVPKLEAAVSNVTNSTGTITTGDAAVTSRPLDAEVLTAALGTTEQIVTNIAFFLNVILARGAIGVAGASLTASGGANCNTATSGKCTTDASGKCSFTCTAAPPGSTGRQLLITADGRGLSQAISFNAYTPSLSVTKTGPVTVTTGQPVSFTAVLSFGPSAGSYVGGYDIVLSAPTSSCNPSGVGLTKQGTGQASFSCTFYQPGTITVTANATEVGATATTSVSVLGSSPSSSPSPGPSPGPGSTQCAQFPPVRGQPRQCFAAGNCDQQPSPTSQCACQTAVGGTSQGCVCNAKVGLKTVVEFTPTNGVTYSKCLYAYKPETYRLVLPGRWLSPNRVNIKTKLNIPVTITDGMGQPVCGPKTGRAYWPVISSVVQRNWDRTQADCNRVALPSSSSKTITITTQSGHTCGSRQMYYRSLQMFTFSFTYPSRNPKRKCFYLDLTLSDATKQTVILVVSRTSSS